MPKLLYYIKTPLGEFASSGQAGRAHKCDRGVILKRCETDPENYQKIPKPTRPKPAALAKNYRSSSDSTWPVSWTQYRYLAHETKEEIYLNWCNSKALDPDAEHSADAFFDDMDTYIETLPESLSTQDEEESVV